MIFRWLLRRKSQYNLKIMLSPDDYATFVKEDYWKYISEMSEWRAFRHYFSPMAALRDAELARLEELQQIIETALAKANEKE